MADKHDDRPDAQGLAGFAKRNFGAGVRGESYGEQVFQGVEVALTAGMPRAKELSASIPVLTAAFVGLGGVLVVYGAADVTVASDPTLTAQIESSEGVSFLQVERGANQYRYMLVSTDGLYALYQAGDHSDADDRLAFVSDPVEALTAVMTMSGKLGAIADAATHDLRSMPTQLPSLVRYERVSPLFRQAGDANSYYRVGDNVSVVDAPLTLAQIQNERALWQAAAHGIVAGGYATPTASQTGDHIQDGHLLWQALGAFFATYAGFAGLGALGGGVGATVSSRRRARRDNRPA